MTTARKSASLLGAYLRPKSAFLSYLPSLACERVFAKSKAVPFSPQQIFDVVADINQYSKFVPFCEASRVTRRLSPTVLEAELAIGFKLFTERYVSKVTLQPLPRTHVHPPQPLEIAVQSLRSSSFDSLRSTWKFAEGPRPGWCMVDFSINLRVSSPLHAHALQLFFAEVAERQIAAFEARCKDLYGRPIDRCPVPSRGSGGKRDVAG